MLRFLHLVIETAPCLHRFLGEQTLGPALLNRGVPHWVAGRSQRRSRRRLKFFPRADSAEDQSSCFTPVTPFRIAGNLRTVLRILIGQVIEKSSSTVSPRAFPPCISWDRHRAFTRCGLAERIRWAACDRPI